MNRLKFHVGYDGELFAEEHYKDFPVYYEIGIWEKFTLNKQVHFGSTIKSRKYDRIGEYDYVEDAIQAAQEDWKKMNEKTQV